MNADGKGAGPHLTLVEPARQDVLAGKQARIEAIAAELEALQGVADIVAREIDTPDNGVRSNTKGAAWIVALRLEAISAELGDVDLQPASAGDAKGAA